MDNYGKIHKNKLVDGLPANSSLFSHLLQPATDSGRIVDVPASIQTYYSEVAKTSPYSDFQKETALRTAFANLINDYAKSNELVLVLEIVAPSLRDATKTVIPDGTLKDILRQDWGYWETKDTHDDRDKEIRKKFKKGYVKYT